MPLIPLALYISHCGFSDTKVSAMHTWPRAQHPMETRITTKKIVRSMAGQPFKK